MDPRSHPNYIVRITFEVNMFEAQLEFYTSNSVQKVPKQPKVYIEYDIWKFYPFSIKRGITPHLQKKESKVKMLNNIYDVKESKGIKENNKIKRKAYLLKEVQI